MENNNSYNPFRLLSDVHLTEDMKETFLRKYRLMGPNVNISI